LLGSLLLAGCGHPTQARVQVPSPPSIEPVEEPTPTSPADAQESEKAVARRAPDGNKSALVVDPALSLPPGAKPLTTETGLASWYGPPYHNRRGSNGEIYNMHAMTAAHRTLPMGSIVRVTNLKTGHSAVVRITDRGPFIEGRVLDLSLAAARKLDVVQAGVARVKLEVMQTPAPIETGGRWAVQIGAFDKEKAARKLADHLSHRYHSAQVLSFNSPTGDWWIRVRVLDDNRHRAEELARETKTHEGGVFLVRLD